MADPQKFDILQLIQGIQIQDPRLYEALQKLNSEINTIYNTLFPVQEFISAALAPLPIPESVDTFTGVLGPDFIYLNWTSSDTNIRFYELRRQDSLSTDWDTAFFVTRTTTLSAVLDPLPAGDHTFLIKTLNASGVFQSGDAVSLVLTVLGPNPPNVTGQVIDNNVLLFWIPGALTSFRIRSYNVYKDGAFVGMTSGTFIAFFELLSGTYVYSVTAVDVAGNESLPSSLSLVVHQPPDFELQDDRFSDFSGPKVDAYVDDGILVVDIDLTETWEQHFLNHSWDQIQDQINAGFPYYLQPADNLDPASYQEEIDYGVVFTNVIFNVIYTFFQLDGTTLVACQIDYKVLPGDPWTPASPGFSAFIPSAQFIRVTLTFTSADPESILEVTSLRFIVNVKQELDSGQVDALAADAAGTVVLFNKAFLDVKSITVSIDQTSPNTAVIEFLDVPNPTEFKVYVFNPAGVRIDSLVYWKARGII